MSGLREHRRPRYGMNIVPMLDVLTTVLLYCLVMMQFKDSATMNIALPEINTAGKNVMTESIQLAVSKDGTYFYNGKTVTGDQLEAILATIGQAKDKPPLVIRADEQTPLKNVTFLMDACRKTGFDDFRLQSREGGD